VNISTRQFLETNLLEKVAEALEETGLETDNLSLEVAESTLMGDAETAVRKFRAIKDLGVGVALDGFGSAYSSLSQLKRLPLDLVKLDRSLIVGLGEEPEGAAVVAAMIDLAHALGWTVSAHGVETADQLAMLCRLGCDLAQGYHFSKPVTSEEASALLEAGTQLISRSQ
jgi:EAL domain-containing protein (putative c-di-GMP-specific phosphodiesterase class I)